MLERVNERILLGLLLYFAYVRTYIRTFVCKLHIYCEESRAGKVTPIADVRRSAPQGLSTAGIGAEEFSSPSLSRARRSKGRDGNGAGEGERRSRRIVFESHALRPVVTFSHLVSRGSYGSRRAVCAHFAVPHHVFSHTNLVDTINNITSHLLSRASFSP